MISAHRSLICDAMVLNRASEIETPDVWQVSKGHGCFENFGVDKVLDKASSPQDLFRLVKPVRSKIICRESFKRSITRAVSHSQGRRGLI